MERERISKLAMQQQKEYERTNQQQELARQQELEHQRQLERERQRQQELEHQRQLHKLTMQQQMQQQQQEAEARQQEMWLRQQEAEAQQRTMQQRREAEAQQLEQQMQQQERQIVRAGVAGPPDSPQQPRGGSPSTLLVLSGADAAVDSIEAALREGQEVLGELSVPLLDIEMLDETAHMKRTAEEQEQTDQNAQTSLSLNRRPQRKIAKGASKRSRK